MKFPCGVLAVLFFWGISTAASPSLPLKEAALRINAINLTPLAQSSLEERGLELRESSSGGEARYRANFQEFEGQTMRVVVPEWAFKKIEKEMSQWFKSLAALSSMRDMVACRKPIAMIQKSKSYPLCLDGLDGNQRRDFMSWYSDVSHLLRGNEW